MKISEHFSYAEMTQTSQKMANQPDVAEVVNLVYLCQYLERLRQVFGPIRVNSAYRSPAVNSAVGGVKNSQHVAGQAADITFGSVSANKLRYEDISRIGGFDQLILERGGQWIHLSVLPPWEKSRGQILKG